MSEKKPKKQTKPDRKMQGTSVQELSKNSERGLASRVTRTPRIGAEDMTFDVSYVCGATYVGNGTLGVAATGYFQDLLGGLWSSNVPVLLSENFASPRLVAAYCTDVVKHYAWAEVERASVELLSLQAATNLACSFTIAPQRGARGVSTFGTGTPGGVPRSLVLGMKGCQRVQGYEDVRIDLTPYIEGGAGSKANRFSTTNLAQTLVSPFYDIVQSACSAFLISGTGPADGSLNGQKVHDVVIRLRLRLLDFLGSNVTTSSMGSSPPDAKELPVDPRSASSAAALPLGKPMLTRQDGYIVVRQEDILPLAPAKGQVPPNDPNRR